MVTVTTDVGASAQVDGWRLALTPVRGLVGVDSVVGGGKVLANPVMAPFSPAVVATLNAYQQAPNFVADCCDLHPDQVLVAQTDGFHCPLTDCGFVKYWALSLQVDATIWDVPVPSQELIDTLGYTP